MFRSVTLLAGIGVALIQGGPAKHFGAIEGHVFDEVNGKPMAGANVLIPNGHRSVTTDENGRYRLDSVEANGPRSFLEPDTVIFVKARRIGYFAENRPVLLQDRTVERLDFRMRPTRGQFTESTA